MTGETLEVADIHEILRLLPHRYPFLMIDRIIDIRGDEHGIGIKNVTINEPQFLGHFPENPVMPGVLMIEGMAQTACVLDPADDGIAREAPHGVVLDHRQSQIPQAGISRRHDRVSRPQGRAPSQHVLVPGRGHGWQRSCRRSRPRRIHERGIDGNRSDCARGRRRAHRRGRGNRPLLHRGTGRRTRTRRAAYCQRPRHRRHDDRRGHRRLSVRLARHAAAIGPLSRRGDAARHRRGVRAARRRHHEYGDAKTAAASPASAIAACSWSAATSATIAKSATTSHSPTMFVLGGHVRSATTRFWAVT